MTTHQTQIKYVAALISAALLAGCSDDNPQQPSYMKDSQPESLNAQSFVPQLVAGEDNWHQADTVSAGKLYKWQVAEPVSGLDKFASHKFSISSTTGLDGKAGTGDGTVLVPHPDRCPADDDYMVEESVPYVVAKLLVSNSDTKQSVLNGDSLDFAFAIPENRYGIEYNATLEYAGQQHQFNLTTAGKNDVIPDELNFKDKVFYDESGVVEVKRTADGDDSNSFVLTDVADEQILRFELQDAVGGMDAFHKVDFTFTGDDNMFTFDGQQFIATLEKNLEFEQGQSYKSVWPVVRQTTSGGSSKAMYNACAQADNDIEVYVAIPDKTFAKTYSAKIEWPDGNGGVHTYNFSVTTAAEDLNVDTDINVLRQQEYDLAVDSDYIVDVPITGINNKVMVSISGDDWVSFSVNGGDFTQEPTEIDEGDTLQVKYDITSFKQSAEYTAGDEYYHEFNPVLSIGDQTFTGYGRTIANPEWPALQAKVAFPAVASATMADTITVRGLSQLVLPDTFTGDAPTWTADNLTISVNGSDFVAVDALAANGDWTHSVTLADGENTIVLRPSAPAGLAESSPYTFKVTKLATADEAYPANLPLPTQDDDINANARQGFGLLEDVAIDTKQGTPVFYIVDQNDMDLANFWDDKNKRDDQIFVFDPTKPEQLNPLFETLFTEAEYIFDIALNNNAQGNYIFTAEHWAGAKTYDISATQPLDATAPVSKLSGGTDTGKSVHGAVFSVQNDKVFVSGNDGLGVHSFDPTTGTLGAIVYINNVKQSKAIDNYVAANGDEYVIISARNNANTWVTKINQADIAASTTTQITFAHLNGTAFNGKLEDLTIDDKTATAYIADGNKIYQFSLANIDALVAGTENADISEVTLTHSLGSLVSLVKEKDLGYLVALDEGDKALLAIDPVTKETVYLINSQ
ncbi:hypothetical protein C2869_07695 [Saccharobesus litoralis]|uniref:Uncharacterized protein n=1 Tax=Saccharobesus litoralis TaxID=2172099 RepID=A0A2S0VQ65_9ALTE|nr:hypothetical protein [Saccharobesus litoralis]AWB66322.1 hypothetical protein C2869_07695 [Saccharobesus litoralis]